MTSPLLFATAAYAQGAPAAAAQPSFLMQFFPFILIFVIIYFLIMRPQQKKQKAHQEMLRNLQKGDKVVTQGGIHGMIAELDEKYVSLLVDERVKLKISRWSVADKADDAK